MKIYLKALGQIFKLTFSILLFISLPLVIFTMITSRMPVFGIRSFVVITGSMEPALPVGSLIFTKVQNVYKPGQIISFTEEARVITHRVVAVQNENGTFYKTKGDANNSPDSELVPARNVVGKQSLVFLNIGMLTGYLKTIPGFLAFIILPFLIFIGSEIMNIKREMEKEIRKKLLKQLSI